MLNRNLYILILSVNIRDRCFCWPILRYAFLFYNNIHSFIVQADSKLRALSASYRLKKPDRHFEEYKNYSNEIQTHINNILKIRAVSMLHQLKG